MWRFQLPANCQPFKPLRFCSVVSLLSGANAVVVVVILAFKLLMSKYFMNNRPRTDNINYFKEMKLLDSRISLQA